MFFFSCSFLCHSLGHSNGIEWENSSNGIEGGPGLCFVSFHSVAQKGETDQSVSCDVFVFFLTHLVSITHPPFQATINMSGGGGAEDWTSAAGSSPAASVENPLGRATNTLTREQLLCQIR